MDEVVSSLAIGVAVPADNDDRDRRVGNPDACRHGEAAAVKAIEEVASHVMGEFAGLSDSGDHNDFMRLQAELCKRLLHRF